MAQSPERCPSIAASSASLNGFISHSKGPLAKQQAQPALPNQPVTKAITALLSHLVPTLIYHATATRRGAERGSEGTDALYVHFVELPASSGKRGKEHTHAHAHVHNACGLLQGDGRNQKEGICMCSIDRIEALRAAGGDGLTASSPLCKPVIWYAMEVCCWVYGGTASLPLPLPTGWPEEMP